MEFKLLKYQNIFIIGALIILLYGYFSAYSVIDCSRLKTPNSNQYKNCTTPFCIALKKTNQVLRSKNTSVIKTIQIAPAIFINNIQATGFELFSIKLPFIIPIISLYQHSSQIGAVAKCVSSKLPQVLFPNGWLEFVSMILFFSFYYAVLLKIVRVILKKDKLIKEDIKIIKWQILLFISIQLIAAILEAASLVIRNSS